MDGNRFTESAHSSDLDVDDFACAEFQSCLCIAPAVDRLIQADTALQLLLQSSVEIEIIMPERLLDHEQVEGIEFFQVVDLVQRISRIGIATQDDLRPASADLFKDFHVPSGLALYLDAAITGVQLSLNFFQQLLVRILNPNGNAAGDFFLRSAQQLPQRHLPQLGFRVP